MRVKPRFKDVATVRSGLKKENYLADCLFINKNSLDLEPMNNVYASIVHRASENSINAVMIGGNIVNGKL